MALLPSALRYCSNDDSQNSSDVVLRYRRYADTDLVRFVQNYDLAAFDFGLVEQLQDDLEQRTSRRRADEPVHEQSKLRLAIHIKTRDSHRYSRISQIHNRQLSLLKPPFPRLSNLRMRSLDSDQLVPIPLPTQKPFQQAQSLIQHPRLNGLELECGEPDLELGVRIILPEVGEDLHDHMHVERHLAAFGDGHEGEEGGGVYVFFEEIEGVDFSTPSELSV